MDLTKMISELQAEKQRLDEAIFALERLSAGKANRRSRPLRWLEEREREELSADAEIPEPEDSLKL
jgi:hypothetical protein